MKYRNKKYIRLAKLAEIRLERKPRRIRGRKTDFKYTHQGQFINLYGRGLLNVDIAIPKNFR